jgi:PX domain
MIELNNGSKSLIEEKEFDPYGNGYLIKPYDPDSESNATLDAKSYKPSLSMDFAYCSNKIGISNPQIRSNLFGKHILYCISGKDSIGGFNVYRRYKEFRSLYLVLLKEWPGCCIPKIAPKKALVTVM